MCCCGKPTVNGQIGAYSWDGKTFSTRQPWAPTLGENDTLIYDEPGRCGGIDAHSHHFRLVKERVYHAILVRHGGGEERIHLGVTARLFIPALEQLDSNARYWWMHSLYSQHREAAEAAAQKRDAYWAKAAAEKRIKTRKNKLGVKVRIEPEVRKEVA